MMTLGELRRAARKSGTCVIIVAGAVRFVVPTAALLRGLALGKDSPADVIVAGKIWVRASTTTNKKDETVIELHVRTDDALVDAIKGRVAIIGKGEVAS